MLLSNSCEVNGHAVLSLDLRRDLTLNFEAYFSFFPTALKLHDLMNIQIMSAARGFRKSPFSKFIFHKSGSGFSAQLTNSRNFATKVSSPSTASPKSSRWWRRSLILGAVGGSIYAYDNQFNSSALTRTLRSGYILSLIAVDYKLNFKEDRDIEKLHERNANRLYSLLIKNKGLYIKIGQALALQAAAFPPAYQNKFAILFDNAPQDPIAQIQKTFNEEFGVSTEEMFESFDNNCIASASVAQVHKAQLKSGEWVAVKIQHSELQDQVYCDLLIYKLFMRVYGYAFELPLGEISSFIASRMEKETDFVTELENAETSRRFLDADSSLNKVVYIPRNYPEYTTKRVMISEWIDGIPLGKKDLFESQGFSASWTLDIMIRFFSKQIFEWGCVHCDPHPGNIMLRKHEGKDQVVIIDHGLYVYETPEFRAQNSLLWKSLFVLDNEAVKNVIIGWGIGSVDMFASMTMMRPYDSRKVPEISTKSDYQMQQEMLDNFKNFIKDINKMPLELVLIGRANSILQGTNRMYGSPVNRIKIMAYQASKSLSELHASANDNANRTWIVRKFLALVSHAKFQVAVLVMDTAFNIVRLRQFFSPSSSANELGMEAVIERQMIRGAKSMGVELNTNSMFSG